MKIKYLSALPMIAVLILSSISLTYAQSDVFTQNLYFGIQNNSQVSQLQEFLTSQGLYSGPTTGNFYFLTLNAVKAFQTQQGITPTAGYFGPMTMAAANKIADAEVSASNAQAISETGTSTPLVSPASSTSQSELATLLQEVALLEQQLQAQQSSTQAVQNLQTQALQQIASNTQSIATVPQSNQTSAPTANFTANGSTGSITIPYNTAATISWSSTNANSCNVSPSGWSGTSGNQSTGNLTASQTYSISCSGAGGSASASVTVNITSLQTTTTPVPSLSISGNSGSLALLRAQPSQSYGTFAITLSGEPITVQTMNFIITSTNPSPSGDSIGSYPAPVIIGPNGNTVATASSSMNGSTFFNVTNLTFSNVTLSNSGIYKIVGAGWGSSGDTMTLSTNPSTNWLGAVGIYGESASLPNTTVSLGTATFAAPTPIPPVISADDALNSLSVNGSPIPNFASSTLSYNYPLPPGTTATPIVAITTDNTNSTEVINQATSPTGSATVLVTAQNGTTKQTYTINFSVEPRLAVTATQNISPSVQFVFGPSDISDITLTANGQGSVTLHNLNITFSEGNNNQGAMTAFLTPAYGFGLEDGSVDVTSPVASGGLAAVATDGSFAVATAGNGGTEIVSWVFPNNNLVVTPGSPVTLHLWGNIGNFNGINAITYPVTASVVSQSDIQYSDSSNPTGNLNSLPPNEAPITIYSVEIAP